MAEPGTEELDAGHAVQIVDREAEYVFAAHVWQDVLPGSLRVPAGQFVQTRVAPVPEEEYPPEHAHVPAPATEVDPIGHEVQAPPDTAYVPAPQSPQERAAPEPDWP